MQKSKSSPNCPPFDSKPTLPLQNTPSNACDTHMHICGPLSTYSYSKNRTYTPPDSLLPNYLHLAQVLNIERVVFVQPSVYGADNTVMRKAMSECPLPNRGVAVLSADVSDKEIEALHHEGVRGVRYNLVDVKNPKKKLPIQSMKKFAERILPLGWHIELLLHVDNYPRLDDELSDLPVDLVVGHLGYFDPGKTPEDNGFQSLIKLMKAKRCWTKLTGPYRLSIEEYPYENVAPFAACLIEEAVDQLVWGSDWPHVCVKTSMPNDGKLLDLLSVWSKQSEIHHKILVENPTRLYDF